MKIGVALSGCDMGGLAAFEVLRMLEEQGLEIGMLSCCGLPSATGMLYAYGYSGEECAAAAEAFLQDTHSLDMDMALAKFSGEFPPGRKKNRLPLVISGVNVSDGRICAFTSEGALATSRLRRFALEDPYDALSATVSPVDGLASYPYRDCQLCDFSVWYGIPVYPLKMTGFQRIVSVAFLPAHPRTPYQVLVSQRLAASSRLADVHIPIHLDKGSLSDYIEAVSAHLAASLDQICAKSLF